jgi:signal transduction histidine kinase
MYVLRARHARQRRAFEERLVHAPGLEALGRMTGGVAHDFNNVLNVIAANLEIVRRRAYRCAIASISRRTPRGKSLTATFERAGGMTPTCFL